MLKAHKTEGFCKAFIDETGLKPSKAVMRIQEDIMGGVMTQRIWFEPKPHWQRGNDGNK